MTNVEKVKAGELAIFNDNPSKLRELIMILWPNTSNVGGTAINYKSTGIDWIGVDGEIDIPTIPATVLLSEIEGKVEAWSPKVGQTVEVSDGKGDWFPRKLLAVVDNQFKYIVESTTEHRSPICFKFCRPIPTKQLTRTEAEALLSDLKGETYKIVD